MISNFFLGLVVGFSLIFAFGPQNIFVLRNGLIRNRVGAIVLFCALSDTLLITVGVWGGDFFLQNFVSNYGVWMLYFIAIWLSVYGFLRLRAAFSMSEAPYVVPGSNSSNVAVFVPLFVFTFLNPHVYLDTVILIGTISSQFNGITKISFALGAICSSFLFFCFLGYCASYASKFFVSSVALSRLDIIISILMFCLAFWFFMQGRFLNDLLSK